MSITQNNPDNTDLRIHLMFIQMVCVSKFVNIFLVLHQMKL